MTEVIASNVELNIPNPLRLIPSTSFKGSRDF